MFPKSAKTRFRDTVAYIQNYAASGLPANIRNDIATMITTRYPRATALQRQVYDQLSESMSVKRHIGGGVAKGTSVEREQRRAIVLLWVAMGSTQPNRLNQGMTLPPGGLAPALNEAMKTAAVVASNAGATHIFNTEFAVHTKAFIGRYRIIVLGTTQGKATFTNPLSASFQNVINFSFYFNGPDDRFELAPTPAPPLLGGSHTFAAVSVPALHWSEVPGRGNVPTPLAPATASFTGILGTELAGANWMVTTQFTGCAFCYANQGGNVYAAHISPAGVGGLPVLTGAVLAGQLMGNDPQVQAGRLANFPGGAVPVNVFGNGVGNAAVVGGNPFYPPKTPGAGAGQMKWMSIFGRVHAGQWKIYTQSVDGADAILEHRRIV